MGKFFVQLVIAFKKMGKFFVQLVIAFGASAFFMLPLLPSMVKESRTDACYFFWKKIFTERTVNAEDLRYLWKSDVSLGEIWDYSDNSEKGFILEIPEGIITIDGKKVAVICRDERIKVYNLSLPENCNFYNKGKWIKKQPKPVFIPSAGRSYILFCIDKVN